MILPSFHPPLHPPPSLRSHSLSPSLLHPFPFHLHSTSPTPTANIQKPPMLLCYCVTVLLRPFVFTSPTSRLPFSHPSLSPTHPSPSHPFISSLSYVRFRSNVYTFSRERPKPLADLFHAIRTRNAKNSSPRIRYNPNFYCTEFDTIRNAAGSNKIQVLEGSGGREFGK